jgi:prephenate dehydrogenase
MSNEESDFTNLAQARVAIVGLGLMGGSLGLALRERQVCREVIGVARRPEICDQAIRMGAVDRATEDAAAGVRDADLVVLATPVRVILRQIEELGPHLKSGAVLIDLGSTKTEVFRAMSRLPDGVQPLGGHPMCGKELSGLSAAEASLYEGAPFILTPLPRTDDRAVEMGEALARAVRARPLVLAPQRHDRLVAAISHLPYLLSVALVRTAMLIAERDEQVWSLAASGFRDTSRLAASDVTMMLDILLTNRHAVGEMIARCHHQLDRLEDLLATGDEEALRKLLQVVQEQRKRLYDGTSVET